MGESANQTKVRGIRGYHATRVEAGLRAHTPLVHSLNSPSEQRESFTAVSEIQHSCREQKKRLYIKTNDCHYYTTTSK